MVKSGRVDPKKYGTTTAKIRGSWWFVLKEADGGESLAHYSPIMTIAEVITRGKGKVGEHVAKYGSKVLDNDRCLEDYKINTNGSKILGDHDWDGKLSVIQITGKNVLSSLLSKIKKGEKATGSKTLEFYLAHAINLPGVDNSGTSDPYVVLSLTDPENKEKPITTKSKTIKKNCNPQWKELVTLSGPWLREENHLDAFMKVKVYDANVIGKDVLLGESDEIPLKKWAEQLKYYTESLRKLWVPLNGTPNSWVELQWIVGTGKPSDKYRSDPLFLIDKEVTPFGRLNDNSDRFANSVTHASYKAGISNSLMFLKTGLVKEQQIEPSDLFQLSVAFNENEDWKKLGPQWNPQLLSKVNRLVLEVKAGHTGEEVGQFLKVVKESPVSEVYLLDFDQSMALEEGMAALKGSSNLKVLKYSDDEGQPSLEGVNALIDLVNGLPKLEKLILSLSESMWKDQTLSTKLLQAVSKSGVKMVVLEDVDSKTEIDFTKFVTDATLEGFSVLFKASYRNDEKSSALASLIASLKGSKISRFEILKPNITNEELGQLVASLQEMPNLSYFSGELGDQLVNVIAPLVESSKTLKYLRIESPYDAKNGVEKLLKAIASNTVIENLVVHNFFASSSTPIDLEKVLEANTTLKKIYLYPCYKSRINYVSPSFTDALVKNKSLMWAKMDLFDYTAFPSSKTTEVNEAWKSRGAKFSA